MILILDVDGTLINYQLQTPLSANRAVLKAQENGHQIYLCTGCSLFEIAQRHFDFVPDGIIGGNGCYIESKGEVIYHETLTKEQCKHFVDWCASKGLGCRLECNSGIYCSPDYKEKEKKVLGLYSGVEQKSEEEDEFAEKIIARDNLYRDDVNKTAFILNSYQDYLDAKEEFSDMFVSTWGGKGELALFGDTSPLGVNKENAVNKLLDYLQVDKEQTIGFGDSKSDLPMFKAVGYKVAMGNGGKEIKEAADYISDDVDNEGLEKAFKYLNLI